MGTAQRRFEKEKWEKAEELKQVIELLASPSPRCRESLRCWVDIACSLLANKKACRSAASLPSSTGGDFEKLDWVIKSGIRRPL